MHTKWLGDWLPMVFSGSLALALLLLVLPLLHFVQLMDYVYQTPSDTIVGTDLALFSPFVVAPPHSTCFCPPPLAWTRRACSAPQTLRWTWTSMSGVPTPATSSRTPAFGGFVGVCCGESMGCVLLRVFVWWCCCCWDQVLFQAPVHRHQPSCHHLQCSLAIDNLLLPGAVHNTSFHRCLGWRECLVGSMTAALSSGHRHFCCW